MPEEVKLEVEQEEVETVEDNYEEFDAAFDEIISQREGSSDEEEDPGEVGDDPGFAEDAEESNVDSPDTSEGDASKASSTVEKEDETNLADELEKIKQENERLKQKERSQRGRVGALTKKLADQQAAVNQPQKDQQGNSVEQQTGEDESDDWDEFERDFPEMAAIVNQRLSKVEQQSNTVQQQVQRVADTTETMASSEIEDFRSEQYGIVLDAHPDIHDIQKDPVFQHWRDNAPAEIQAKRGSLYAEDAISIIDAFKDATGKKIEPEPEAKSDVEKIVERRQKNLSQSAGISSRKVGQSVSDNTDNFDLGFEEAVKKKEKQRAVRY